MKRLATTALLTALAGTAAQADIVRVEAGAGAWGATPSGKMTYDGPALSFETIDIKDDLGFTSTKTMPYVWLLVKHPVPVLPNLRLEYTNIDFDANANRSFDWSGFTYDVATQSNVKITQYDAALYYNILDNTFWTTIDLGIDVKYADMSFTFQDAAGLANPYKETGTITLPMGYLRGRVEVPLTGFGVEADVKYIGFAGSTIYDARIKADYTLDFVPVVQPGLEIGYRIQKYKIDDGSIDVKTDIDFAGVYGGLMVRF